MVESAPALKRELRLGDLVLFNIAAVLSVRWIGVAAHAGPGSVSLWVLAIAAFFVPSALVVSSLSRRFPQEGGMYIWTKQAFGNWHGFLCAWLYFVSNLLYLPNLGLAVVAMSRFIWSATPNTAGDPRYATAATLALIWFCYLAHLAGLRIGKWTENIGGAATYLCVALLILAGLTVGIRSGSLTPFNIVPVPSWENLNLWSQIAFALVGLELAPIMGGEIVDPRRMVPRAAWISAVGCAVLYVGGSSAILTVMRPAEVSQVTGTVQAAFTSAARLNLPAFGPLFAVLISIGGIGGLASWIVGNTRLPFALGLDHYFPAAFARLHPRWGTPYVSILSQAFLVSLFLLISQAGETLTAAYQILVDMTVITTFLPYVYIFATGWRFGQPVASAFGLTISVLAIGLSAVPPPEAVSWKIFELKVAGGCILLAYLGRIVFLKSKARA